MHPSKLKPLPSDVSPNPVRGGRFGLRLSTLACAAALVAGLQVSEAWALALGRASVQSSLGEPLRAEIDVPSITAEEASTLSLRVGGAEAFRAAGMDMNALLSDVQFNVVRRADGRTTIRLQSSRPVTEPFLDLIVEAEWSAGRLVRGYTMLFDPPALRSAQPALAPVLPAAPAAAARPATPPVPAAAAVPPAPPATSVVTPTSPAPAAARAPAPATPAPAAGRSADLTVRTGDTAGRIAAAHKPPNVSLDQMLVALLQNNPHAFIGNNINRMKAGVVLNLPDADQAGAVDATTARQTIAAQSRDFNEFRRRLAGAAGAAPAAESKRESTGRLQTEVQDKAAAAPTPDRLTLSKGAAPAGREADIAQQRAQQDSSTRVAELSRNIEELNKLQGAQSAGTPAAPPAASPAATPGVTAPVAAPPAPAPAAEPAPAPAAAPSPAPAPAPSSEGLLQGLMDNPLVLPAAGGLAALLGLLALLRLRKKKTGDAGAEDESRLHGESFFNASGSHEGPADEAAAAGAASSMMYSPSQLDAAGDVDPVAEADVYLAYGRDAQAEEILREAARLHPERIAVHSKLLEIYAKRGDKAAMEAVASEIYALTNGAGEDWEHACRVAHPVDPDNPLYMLQGASRLTAATVSLPLADEPANEATPAPGAAADVDLDLDLDLNEAPDDQATPDLELPELAPEPVAEAPATEPPPAPEDDFSVEFDLDLPSEPSATATAAAPAPATDDAMGLDFELDLGAADKPAATDEPPAAVGESTEDPTLDLDAFNALAEVEAPAAVAPAPLELDLNGLNLDLDTPASEPASPVADIADPLETKLSLAEEFQAIGDTEGARSLAEEVRDEAEGELKARAEAFLSSLA